MNQKVADVEDRVKELAGASLPDERLRNEIVAASRGTLEVVQDVLKLPVSQSRDQAAVYVE